MPPWENTTTRQFTCTACGVSFHAKREARFCSAACRERSRPKRAHEPDKARQWREKRLEQPGYRERENRLANERAATVRDWLDTYKVEHGCADCGYRSHPVALDFDHIGDGKTMNVCNAKSIAAAEREIAKCEVVCANCHRVRTAKRMAVRHR